MWSPSRLNPRTTTFFIYINDLNYALKFSSASHFADDTSIIYTSKNPKTLETNINFDLKSVSEWLKSNRLSLNARKTKLLLFRSKCSKIQFENISIKIQGVKLSPCKYVKYLGVLIDANLSWDYHISELSKKLSLANGIIMKLRHYAPQSALISVYYAIFYSHLNYGCSVWSLTTNYNLDTINVLQKKCIRSIKFAPYNSHTTPLFAETKLLKFEDMIIATKLKFAFDFKTGDLPDDLKGMFQFSNGVHSYMR